jgi:putative spermidine/putrescine transport system permease protein
VFSETRRSPRRPGWGLLALPGATFLVICFAWPVVAMVSRAFTEPTLGVENFRDFLASPIGPRSLVLTLQTGAIVTVACLLVGYPYAYALVVAPRRVAAILLTLMLASLWLNIVARTFAWQVILRDTGVINKLLLTLGWIDYPIGMINTQFAVTIGMAHILLPSMVLPLYVVMSRLDPELPRAAASLGAAPVRSFITVFLPLSLPGAFAGALLVFVQAIGFYITPYLLGGGSYLMMSQLIVNQTQHLQWGAASAMALILVVAVLLCLVLASRVVRLRDVFGAGAEL